MDKPFTHVQGPDAHTESWARPARPTPRSHQAHGQHGFSVELLLQPGAR